MPYLSTLEVFHDEALYKSTFTLAYIGFLQFCICHSWDKFFVFVFFCVSGGYVILFFFVFVFGFHYHSNLLHGMTVNNVAVVC